MNVVPINSLSIDFGTYTHTTCKVLQKNEQTVYGELLDKMTLKYLKIVTSMFFEREHECPGILFVISLLRVRLSELRALKTDFVRSYIQGGLGDDWMPMLPKLTVLDCGIYIETSF